MKQIKTYRFWQKIFLTAFCIGFVQNLYAQENIDGSLPTQNSMEPTQNSMKKVPLDFPLNDNSGESILTKDMPTINLEQSENLQQSDSAILLLKAKLTETGEDLSRGVIWRIYEPKVKADNSLPLVATMKGGDAKFDLKPGNYVVYASFGQAAVMRRVTLETAQPTFENIVFDAGGLKLNATMQEGQINPASLSFKIYSDDSENDDTSLVLADVKSDKITRLKAGNYHIVSTYGSINAVSRSNIRIDPGKITEVTMQHHAAQITLKLVRQEGSEALADTSWSITTDSGDIVMETVGAYVSLILSEGEYVAIAKNKDQIYQKAFSVSTGNDENIDVVANTQNMQPFGDELD